MTEVGERIVRLYYWMLDFFETGEIPSAVDRWGISPIRDLKMFLYKGGFINKRGKLTSLYFRIKESSLCEDLFEKKRTYWQVLYFNLTREPNFSWLLKGFFQREDALLFLTVERKCGLCLWKGNVSVR